MGIEVVLGIVVGFGLDVILERMEDEFEMMELALAILILVMGAAHYLETSVITACMVVGIVSKNRMGDSDARMRDL